MTWRHKVQGVVISLGILAVLALAAGADFGWQWADQWADAFAALGW
jgi:hypothetical protein